MLTPRDILQKLHPAVAAVAPIDGITIKNTVPPYTITIQFQPSASASEQAAGQAVVNAFDFVDRDTKLADIDARTVKLLSAGWTYATEDKAGQFSFDASPESMSVWTNIKLQAEAGNIKFPIEVGTTDPKTTAQLTSLTDVQKWYQTGADRATYITQVGAKLKSVVSSATTQADVDAVVDDRV